MANFFRIIAWLFGHPFVWITLVVKFFLLKSMARRYRRDPSLVEFGERYAKVVQFAKLLLFVKRVKYEEFGRKKIEDKPLLFVANHKSNLDPVVLIVCIASHSTPKPIFIAKKELAASKLADLYDLIDTIYIDRDNLRQVVEAVKEQVEVLKSKNSIVIFPEGTRVMEENEFGEFKAGAFAAAYQSFTSIQPIVLSNTLGGFERRSNSGVKLPRPFLRDVKIDFLNLVQPIEFMNVNKTIFAEKIRQKMLDEYLKLKSGKVKKEDE